MPQAVNVVTRDDYSNPVLTANAVLTGAMIGPVHVQVMPLLKLRYSFSAHYQCERTYRILGVNCAVAIQG